MSQVPLSSHCVSGMCNFALYISSLSVHAQMILLRSAASGHRFFDRLLLSLKMYPILSLLCSLTSILTQTNQTKTVSLDVLNDLQLFAEYGAAAYCPANYLTTTNASISCPGSICPLLQNASTQVVSAFSNVSEHQTTGMVTLDHSRQLTVITFRGTVSDVDWQTDLDFIFHDASDICEDCWVHSGFLDSWMAVKSSVLGTWNGLQTKYGNYKTVVAGHSLGGALGQICATSLKNARPNATISLYTYGSPRVGNEAFASFMEAAFGANNHRATHLNDPVPRQPPRSIGFDHAGPEYHITSPHIPDALRANKSVLAAPANMVVNPSDVIVIVGPENVSGNLGYNCSNVAMHDEYFTSIAGCVTHQGSPLLEGEWSVPPTY